MNTILKDTISNAHNSEGTQSEMDTIPNGHHPKQAQPPMSQFQMDTIPNRHHLEWTPSRIHPEYTPSRMSTYIYIVTLVFCSYWCYGMKFSTAFRRSFAA